MNNNSVSLTRGEFLSAAITITAGGLLAACGKQPTPFDQLPLEERERIARGLVDGWINELAEGQLVLPISDLTGDEVSWFADDRVRALEKLRETHPEIISVTKSDRYTGSSAGLPFSNPLMGLGTLIRLDQSQDPTYNDLLIVGNGDQHRGLLYINNKPYFADDDLGNNEIVIRAKFISYDALVSATIGHHGNPDSNYYGLLGGVDSSWQSRFENVQNQAVDMVPEIPAPTDEMLLFEQEIQEYLGQVAPSMRTSYVYNPKFEYNAELIRDAMIRYTLQITTGNLDEFDKICEKLVLAIAINNILAVDKIPLTYLTSELVERAVNYDQYEYDEPLPEDSFFPSDQRNRTAYNFVGVELLRPVQEEEMQVVNPVYLFFVSARVRESKHQ